MEESGNLTGESPEGESIIPQVNIDFLPPWGDCNFSQKIRLMSFYILIYLPVFILVLVICTMVPVYITCFVYPMAFGNDDEPELYYWHSDKERATAKSWGITCLVLLLVFVVMFVLSFYKALTTSPGGIPNTDEWQMKEKYDENLSNSLPLVERKQTTGTIRTCSRCSMIKPDRCHHCRLCDGCILKMDHHCPWIANCVGFYNYKYFFLMVTYGMLSLWLFTATFWMTVVVDLRDDGTSIIRSFFMNLVYSLMAILALAVTLFWCFHIYLITNAMTTIEYCEKWNKKSTDPAEQRVSPFKLSCYDCFKNALGQNPCCWLFPFWYRTQEETGLQFKTALEDQQLEAGGN